MIIYEDFVIAQPDATFFQSWQFGEFQEKIPYRGKSWALLLKKPEASCLVIKQKLPFGFCWLWVPYGPLGFSAEGGSAKSGRDEIFEDIARIAKEEHAIFARIEPPLNWREEYTKELKTLWRIKPAFTRYTPQRTLIVDIDKPEEEILAQMKPKGRYNIKLAQKHGVVVKKWDGDEGELQEFYRILQKTAVRDKFGIHPIEFYEKLLGTLPKEMVSLFLAQADTLIAGIIVVFYKDTATYYYGASDNAYRSMMVPYLLQWEAIKEAKKRSLKFYDFLGIAPANVKNHPWVGVTKFKKKFGGREINYPEAFEIVYKPFWYQSKLVIARLKL